MKRITSYHFVTTLILSCLSNVMFAQEYSETHEIFPTFLETDIPYRIPAIACAKNGNLIAVADYRYNRMDIGFSGAGDGRIDLRARISQDDGCTWQPTFTIVRGQGRAGDVFNTGFGDPCIVADRNSSHVFLLSCAGNVSFQGGSRTKHQGIAIIHSNDNGRTWSQPTDIAEHIYGLFDNTAVGPVKSLFIGSGKIHQSRYTKIGDYYRLYCSTLVRDTNGKYLNFILYSDDFGYTWKILGNTNDIPIQGGDEPKAEELPDGRVLLSSRCGGGRFFNIFEFTNEEAGTGKWDKQAFSGADNNGTTAVQNSCNGEIIILPVIRKADHKSMYLALQSVPFGPGRTNVGIYYKELNDKSDYDTPKNFAKNWTGRIQATNLPSAYSTMILQADNCIGFLFEEETHCTSNGGGYTIKYNKYTIENLTDNKYRINKKKIK